MSRQHSGPLPASLRLFIQFSNVGREVNTPADIAYGIVEPQGNVNYDDFVETVKRRTMSTVKI